jgi:hypothetical protein
VKEPEIYGRNNPTCTGVIGRVGSSGEDGSCDLQSVEVGLSIMILLRQKEVPDYRPYVIRKHHSPDE